jgi:hypothetical protein
MRRADGWDRRVRFLSAVVAARACNCLMVLDEWSGEPNTNRTQSRSQGEARPQHWHGEDGIYFTFFTPASRTSSDA